MEVIDDKLLSQVVAEAKKSPRLRMNYNFHQSLQDKCHRFLNALEPGTQIPVHHHPTKAETFVILKGKVRVTTYNDDGEIMVRSWKHVSSARKTVHTALTSPRTSGMAWNVWSQAFSWNARKARLWNTKLTESWR